MNRQACLWRIVIACLCLALAGCDSIDRAISALDQQSSDWQVTLKELESRLVREGKAALANEVTQLMQRGIATGGIEFRCNADFVGQRMKQALQRIQARIKGRPAPPLEPGFCVVSPTAVDMAHRPQQVEYSGYDLDVQDQGGVQAFLTYDGGEIPLARWAQRPTHYLMTVVVAPTSDVPLCNKENRRIVLRWGSHEMSSVAVVKAACEQIDPDRARTYLNREESLANPWILGGIREDHEYGGTCSAGYLRFELRVTKLGGDGHCEGWWKDANNVADCRGVVHYGADNSIRCRVIIGEVPRPAPCTCW